MATDLIWERAAGVASATSKNVDRQADLKFHMNSNLLFERGPGHGE
jgi:hypothetical protein